MKPSDAELVMGDWSKPHRLNEPSRRAYDGKPLGTGLEAVTCSCGFRVTSSPEMSARLAETHLMRAEDKGETVERAALSSTQGHP